MDKPFEELDCRATDMGLLILRRRRSAARRGEVVYEVKLDDAFLMSSLVDVSERALADLALKALTQIGGQPANLLVGGLGLGHTAEAALQWPDVSHLTVIEYLEAVIDWHRHRLVPASDALIDDPRCRLVHDDFFRHVAMPPAAEAPRYDAILVDIDHAPHALLSETHAAFYHVTGLESVRAHLRRPGVFALWSAAAPEDAFKEQLNAAFDEVALHPVSFFNPHLDERDTNWIALGLLTESDPSRARQAG